MAANATFNEQFAGILFPTPPVTKAKLRARIELLRQWNLLARDPRCRNGHSMGLEKRDNLDGFRLRCYKNVRRGVRCDETRGLRIGTFFEWTELDLGRLTYAMYLWTLRITGKSIAALSGLSQNYVVKLRQHIRATCANDFVNHPITIDGSNGWTVQVDESLFNHKPKRVGGGRARGRRARQQIWVFGMLETRPPAPGRGVYLVVPNRSRRVLTHIINHFLRGNNVEIHSDCWRGYLNLPNFVPRCAIHLTVNHSRHFVDPITGAHIQGIESAWNRIKGYIKSAKGCRRDYLQTFLNEHMWFDWQGGNNPFQSICRATHDRFPV